MQRIPALGFARLNPACIGVYACAQNNGGYCAQNSVTIGTSSCKGDGACYFNGGDVGDNSCNGELACAGSCGTIGDNACKGAFACKNNTADIGPGQCNGPPDPITGKGVCEGP